MTRIDELYVDSARRILEQGFSELDVGAQVRAKWEGKESAYARYLPQQMTLYEPGEVPIIHLRKIAWKSAIKEILWIYKDRSNDVDFLESEYGVRYWNEWKNDEGTLGTAYGYQIAKEFISPETGEPIDQMRRVIELLRNDPLNRRILTTLIDFGDLSEMTLVPCAFQTLWTVAGNRLHMTLIQRSGDFLAAAGPGSINAFQYYALLRMVAQVTGYEPGQFVHFVQNLHIYERHIPQIEEIIRVDVSDKKAPRLELNPDIRTFEDFTIDDFTLSDYEPAEGKYDIPIAL